MLHSTSCCISFSWPCLAGLFLLCFSATQLKAQPSWDWAVGEGAGSEQEGNAVTTDENANAYVTGFMKNNVSFGSYNVNAVGGEDIFICKYNSSAVVQWAIGAGGNNDDEGESIAVDSAGNVYITGFFMGTATFFGSPNIVLTSYGAKDIFIAKYSAAGILQWAKKAGSNGDDIGYGICTDGTNVYITGGFRGTATFGSFSLTTAGAEDIFIAAYDASSGTEVWARRGGGTPNDEGHGIAVDNSGVYVTGYFGNGSCSFQNQTGTLTSNGGEDIFLVKYDLSGSGQWIRRAGSSGNDRGSGVSTNGTLLGLAGYFGNTISFYNSSGPAVATLNNTAVEDALVACYNASNGNYSWAHSENGSGTDRATGIAVTSDGYFFTAGYYQGTLPFGSGPSVTSSQQDPYVTAYDATGTFLWGKRAYSSDNNNDLAMGIAAVDRTVQYVAGYYQSTPLWFDFNQISSSSNNDIFTARLECMITLANAGPDQNLCSSSATLAGNQAVYGTGTWSLISGTGTILSPTSRNSVVTGLSPGNNIFQWTISTTTCGSTADTVIIHVDANPTTANAGTDQQLCVSSAVLNANPVVTGSGSWALVSGTGTIASPNTASSNISNLSVGANIFQWTTSNGVCPSSIDSVTIYVDAMPTPANAGNDQTICSSSATLSGNTISTGAGSWSLVSGSGTISSPSSPNASISNLGIGANVFQWTSSNGACPSSSDSVTVFVDANPSPAVAGPDQTICSAITLLAADTLMTGSGQWSLISGTGNFSNANAITTNVSGLSSGANTFQWTCTNGVCPVSADTITIFVDDNPTPANAGADQLICSSSATFSGNTITTGIGLWTLLSGTGIILSPNSPTANVNNLSVGPNIFLWTIINGVCPASIDTVKIQVDANPTTAFAGPDQQLCASSATVSANLPLIGTGQWSLLSGSATIVSPNAVTTNVTNLSPGTSVLQWTITNGVCPASSDQLTIQVDAMPDAANAGVDHLVCETNDTLSANIPVTGTGNWFTIGTTAVLGNPNDAASTVSNLVNGSNFFEWVITNGVCPSSHDTMEVFYTPAPSPAVAGADIAVCGTVATLSAQAPAIGQGHWTNLSGTGTFIDSTSATTAVTNLADGDFYFTWTTTNSYCTSTPDTVMVAAFSPPSIAVAGTDQLLHTPFAQLDGNLLYTGTGTWLVLAGNGVPENPHDPHTRVENLSVGTNVLVWQASNGVCPTNADTVVIVRESLIIPSGFSPNGDNTNDRFEINGLLEYNGVSLEVFNRWGNRVYRSDDYRNDWNGTGSQGEMLPDDIYYFLLDVPGDQTYTGYIAIKRTLQ